MTLLPPVSRRTPVTAKVKERIIEENFNLAKGDVHLINKQIEQCMFCEGDTIYVDEAMVAVGVALNSGTGFTPL